MINAYKCKDLALLLGLLAFTSSTRADEVLNSADTAWILTASGLVLFMTVPGLALFYGGLVRSKNMLSVLAQVFYTVCVVTVIWAVYGYSLTFTGGSDFESQAAVAVDLQDPLAVLQTAGQVLGLSPTGDTPATWLASAVQAWQAGLVA